MAVRIWLTGIHALTQFLLGSRTRLPAPSPLRTVHGSFDPHGSSLCKGIFSIPGFTTIFFGILMTPTAIEMVYSKIARCVRTAFGFFHNVANIPRDALCDFIMTGRTYAILPEPDPVKLPPTSC